MITESHLNAWTEKEGILHAVIHVYDPTGTDKYLENVVIIERIKLSVNNRNEPESDDVSENLHRIATERAEKNDDVFGGLRHKSFGIVVGAAAFNILH